MSIDHTLLEHQHHWMDITTFSDQERQYCCECGATASMPRTAGEDTPLSP